MTTPAVNIDYFLKRTSTRKFWTVSPAGIASPPTYSAYSSPRYKWVRDQRPSSGNTAVVNGFRKCRAWNHSGRNYFVPPITNTMVQNSGPTLVYYEFDNAGFWQSNLSPPEVPSPPSSLIPRAEMKALDRLKNQDINLGTFLAEFSKTEQMIGDRISKIANSVRRWRRINAKSTWDKVKQYQRGGCGRRFVRNIPSSWLELQYGWNPLLSDIFGGINHLGRPGRDPLISVRGYAQDDDELIHLVSGGYGASVDLAFEVVHRCWVNLVYELNNAGLAEVSSLGLLNPVEIIWELVPYSFVVDWVVPIGPWMSSLTADAGWSFVTGSRSVKSEFVGDSSVKRFTRPAGLSGPAPTFQGWAANFTRSCYTSTPVPDLYVKNPLTARHVANATALLVLAFR